jgi:tryptophan-rich sensory protein
MPDKNAGMPPALAATIASSAYLLPYFISRSASPSPDHPEIWLWYRTLKKPSFNPPDAVFPIVWGCIETALAWSGYRMLRQPSTPARNRSLALLATNVVGIGAWSRLFFGSRNLPASTVASAALGVSAAAYVAQAAKVDKKAAAAALPLVGWVFCATILAASVWQKNR